MTRNTASVPAHRKRRKIVKLAKGYYGRRKSCYKVAKDAVHKAWQYAYRDRRNRKRDMRKLWIQRINAAVRAYGLKYSIFMDALNKKGIDLNRKMLSEIAINNPEYFEQIVSQIKGC